MHVEYRVSLAAWLTRAADQDVLVRLDPVTAHQASEQGAVQAARMPVIDLLRGGGLFLFGAIRARRTLCRPAGLSVPRTRAGQATGSESVEPGPVACRLEFIDGGMVSMALPERVVIRAAYIGVTQG